MSFETIMRAKKAFEAGKQAALEGKTLSDNPHTCGITKFGNAKLTKEGIEWESGFYLKNNC